MTDIEKRAYEAYPELDNTRFDMALQNSYINSSRQGYIKACEEYESLPKVRGWVARDKYGSLNLFGDKPTRFEDDTFGNIKGSGMIFLNDELLPEVTWESEPVEVELLIRKVESTKQV